MRALLRFLSWRHASHHVLRTVLAVASIALGVALFVSTEVAHRSTERAFSSAVERLAGKARWRITRGRGLAVEEEVLGRVEALEGVHAAPVVEARASLPDLEHEGSLLVLGVDPPREGRLRDLEAVGGLEADPLRLLLDRTSVLLTRAFAVRNGLAIGSSLRLATPAGGRTVRVGGLVEATGPASIFGGNVAFMFVDGAQELFAMEGTFDRIDVAPAGGARHLERLRAALGSEYRVEPVQARDKILDDMLANIRALTILGVIALLVGLFIVYLAVSIGVVERSKAIGTIRALGASRAQVQALFLSEAALLGVVGSVAGVAGGWGLAALSLDWISETVNVLVQLVAVEEVVLPPWVVAAGLAAGTTTALAAAWFPARRAARISPLEALRPAILGARLLPDYRKAFVAGLVPLLLGVLGSVRIWPFLPDWSGYAAAAVTLVGVALTLPQIVIWTSRLLRRPLASVFRVEGFLAADNALRYPQRSAMTSVALGGALSLLVASTAIISSFRSALDRWMDDAFPFDLSVQPLNLSPGIYGDGALPPEVLRRTAEVEGVEATYGVRAVTQEYGDADVLLLALDLTRFDAVRRSRGELDPGEAYRPGVTAGRAVVVSRNFALLQGVGAGEELELRTPSGLRRFPVAQEVEDYSWPKGTVIMDLALYRRVWRDESLSYVDVLVSPGHDVRDVRARISGALADDQEVFVFTNEDIRAFADGAVDKSFTLVNAQVVVAMTIGFLGIVNTLLISVLQRKREIGLLRIAGMTRRQVAGTVVVEAVLIALVAGTFGCLGGLGAAALPAAHQILIVTGYELPLVVPWGMMGAMLGLSVAIGLAASLVPSLRATRTDVLEAVGYE